MPLSILCVNMCVCVCVTTGPYCDVSFVASLILLICFALFSLVKGVMKQSNLYSYGIIQYLIIFILIRKLLH